MKRSLLFLFFLFPYYVYAQQPDSVYLKKVKGYRTLIDIDSLKAAQVVSVVDQTALAARALQKEGISDADKRRKLQEILTSRRQALDAFLTKAQIDKIFSFPPLKESSKRALAMGSPGCVNISSPPGSLTPVYTNVCLGTIGAGYQYSDNHFSSPVEIFLEGVSRPRYVYNFTVTETTELSITTCSSEIGTILGVTRGKPYDEIFESGPLCANLNGSFSGTFPPGDWFVIVQSSGFDSGYVGIDIKSTPGAAPQYDPSGAGLADLDVIQKTDSLLGGVSTSGVTTGILYPRGTSISGLDGYYDDAPVSYEGDAMQLAYKELYLSAYNPSDLLSPIDLFAAQRSSVEPGTSFLNVLNFDFQVLDSTAVQNGLLYYGPDGALLDVPGRAGSPYLQKHVLIVAPLETTFSSNVLRLKASNYSVSERASRKVSSVTLYSKAVGYGVPVKTFSLVNDGHKSLPDDGTFMEIAYDKPAIDTIRAVVTYSDLSTETGYFPVHMEFGLRGDVGLQQASLPAAATGVTAHIRPATAQKTKPLQTRSVAVADPATFTSFTEGKVDETISITSSIPFQGYGPEEKSGPTSGVGTADIFYAVGNLDQKLRKPVILINGFEPKGDKRGLDIYNKLGAYDQQTDGSARYLGSDLRLLGYDVIILTFTGFKQMGNKQLYARGADYIERNAFVLYDLINLCNRRLRENGSQEKLVVIGPSMGSLVSRYALCYMEKNGIDHNTRLWISFDGPHLGASVPIGEQRIIDFTADVIGVESARNDRDNKINSPAAQEMLIESTLGHATDVTFEVGASPFRQRFLKNLADVGDYPKRLRRVAISNGSLQGLAQKDAKGNRLGACQPLLELKVIQQKGAVKQPEQVYFSANTIGANNQRCQVYEGFTYPNKIWATVFRPFLTAFGGTVRRKSFAAGSGPTSLDVCPGGYTNLLSTAIDDGLRDEVKKHAFLYKYQQSILNPNTTFIPTFSALGIKNVTDYGEALDGRNQICEGRTFFDAYYAPQDNEDHVSITDNNVAFIRQELAGDTTGPSRVGVYRYGTSLGPGDYSVQRVDIDEQSNYLCEGQSGVYRLIGAPPSSVEWEVGPGLSVIDGQGSIQCRVLATGGVAPSFLRAKLPVPGSCAIYTPSYTILSGGNTLGGSICSVLESPFVPDRCSSFDGFGAVNTSSTGKARITFSTTANFSYEILGFLGSGSIEPLGFGSFNVYLPYGYGINILAKATNNCGAEISALLIVENLGPGYNAAVISPNPASATATLDFNPKAETAASQGFRVLTGKDSIAARAQAENAWKAVKSGTLASTATRSAAVSTAVSSNLPESVDLLAPGSLVPLATIPKAAIAVGNNKAVFNVAGLKPGFYYIHLHYKNRTEKQTLMVN